MSNLIQITKDQTGKEIVMVRVDKTLKQMMEEKPSSRWSANYWHPKFDNLFKNIKTRPLAEFIVDIQGGGGGSHFSDFLGDKWSTNEKYATYLHISSIIETGINWVDAKYIDERTYNRLKSKQLRTDDILLSNKGTVGKSVVVYRNFPKTVVGDTRVIRIKNLNPYYLCIFLKSYIGQMLSEKFKSGVASEGTTVDQLEEFPIPILKDSVQNNIESEYKKMSVYHDKAMDDKKRGDEMNLTKNLKIAEDILRELIIRTETVIRGEREDVV